MTRSPQQADFEEWARKVRERLPVVKTETFPDTPHTRGTESPWDYPKAPVFDWKD